MRKPFKIALCVVALTVAVGLAAVAWQWDNITALRYSLTMSRQNVEENIEKNDQQLKDVLDQYQIPEHSFSKEELDVISGNEGALEDATNVLLNLPTPEVTAPLPTQEVQPSAGQPPLKPTPKPTPKVTPKAEKTDYTAKIRAQIARMYVLKATYVSELEGIVSATKAEFVALPANQRTDAKKQAVVMARVGELSALEGECDKKVATVVTELRRLLKADGQSGATADLVETTYANEKSLKKAYYIREFTQ